MQSITKTGSRIADSYEFVLTTETPDRVGDVIVVSGINTKAFEKNPIALFMHRHDEPIGVWSNLKRTANAMTGRLNLAAKGTSKYVDFAHSMIEQAIIKAVSVSILPKEYTPNKGRGITVTESELVEVSLVSVPMNPQALMIAKSFDFSEEEISGLFQSSNAQHSVNCDRAVIVSRAKAAILAANRTIRS